MEDTTPTPLTPPPPPPPSTPKTNLPMLYYGLVVVGTTALVLALYNLIIIKWCAHHHRRSRQRMFQTVGPTSSRSFDNPNRNLVSSFKYKRERVGDEDEVGCDYECAVCLSVFEEGEEVRKLPRCNHSFHAPCIDMWLYSHLDCPVCRAPVEPPVLHRHIVMTPSENSREELLDPSISV